MNGVLEVAERCEWARGGGEGTRDRENGRRDEEGVAWRKGACVSMARPCMGLRVGVGVGVGGMYVVVGASGIVGGVGVGVSVGGMVGGVGVGVGVGGVAGGIGVGVGVGGVIMVPPKMDLRVEECL